MVANKSAAIGDWVCWMCAGNLVLGVVRYIKEDDGSRSGIYAKEIYTDNGVVRADAVLEIRGPESRKK